MTQPRRFARIRPTGQASGEARLILDPKAPVVACRMVDYSAGGACVELSNDLRVPPRLELLHGGVKKRCRVVWRRGLRLGLAF
jgi:hypothetical protein